MGRQIEIGPVEPRLVPVGAGDADLRVVGHQLRRHAAHEGERPDMRADPVWQRLGPARLGIGVIGGAHGGDEDLCRPDLAGPAVNQIDRLAGIVDEHALAGRMGLAHRWRQPAFPGAVQLAPAAVGVTARLALPVFLPQQHQGDAGPAQLVVDMGSIGLGLAPSALLAAVPGIQHRLQYPVGQRRRQWPAQSRHRDALQGQRHRAARDAQRSRDRPVSRAAFVLEAQNSRTRRIDTLSAGIGPPARRCRDEQSAEHYPAVERLPPLSAVADFKSESVADFIPESVADFARNTHAPAHAPPCLWLQVGERWAGYPSCAALPRAQEHSAHRPLHSAVPRAVQVVLG